MKKTVTMFIGFLAAGAAAAGVICSGSGAAVGIDTRIGVRVARAIEPLAYSTEWNTGATGVTIAIDGETLFSAAAPVSGDYLWDASYALYGLHTLTLDDGVETLSAQFAVAKPGALAAWGSNGGGQYDVPDGTNFVSVAAGNGFAVGLKSDGTVELWGDDAGSFYYSITNDLAQISARESSWIGLRSDGSIFTHERWGYPTEAPETVSNSVFVAAGGTYYRYERIDEWGWNSYYLGKAFFSLGVDGVITGWTSSGVSVPVPAYMHGAIAIAAGNSQLLAAKADGTVCVWIFGKPEWQADYEGLGAVPTGLADVKAVAAGGSFGIALKKDGSVVVWGDNYNNYGVKDIPAEAVNVVEIAAGSCFCMARTEDGRVIAWGGNPWNDYGETDMPAFLPPASSICAGNYGGVAIVEPTAPVFHANPADFVCHVGEGVKLETGVSAVPAASLQWFRDGTPVDGADGERLAISGAAATDSGDYRLVASNALGVATSAVARVTVDPRPALGRIYKLTGAPFVGNRLVLRAKPCGDLATASYAWKRDGITVATTERLDIAALEDEDFGTYTLTVTTPYGTATSEPYVVEPARAGVPVGWGADDHGRTTAPEGLTGVAQVASGMNFNIGLATNGTVTAWGYNGHGGCEVPGGLSGVSFVAAGGYVSQGAGFAVKTDGTVAAWGRPYSINGYWSWRDIYDENWNWIGSEQYWYEYTNGWDTVSTIPADLADVVKVAVGGESAIALMADGSVVSWGNPSMDAMPDGLCDVVDVAAGSSFLMALKADGSVEVWNDGDTWYGEANVPDGLSGVVAIAAGKETYSGRACFALMSDGTIVKWGDRYNYFGIGSETKSGAIAIDAGQEHLMALDVDGNVSVWSDWDNYGVRDVPWHATNAISIAAGGYHCTAIVPDSDGDSICDAEEISYGRDPLVWEEWRRSTVGGTVSTDLGAVAGALVTFFDASGNQRGAARTDENGSYSAANLVPADYTIKVEAQGAVDVWYDGVVAGSGETPTPYAVPGNAAIDNLDFMLDPGQGSASAGISGLEPNGGENGDLVEVPIPDGTVVYLDMWPVETGTAGMIDIGEIPASHTRAASHTVTLKLPGANAAVPSPVGVNGREGEPVQAEIVTDGPRCSLSIATYPAGATVYVDYADQPIGVTPLSIGNLLPGSHAVILKKDGYLMPRPVVATVSPEDEPTEVAVPLHTAAETNEMTVAVTCVLPDQEIYIDYLPTGEVAPAIVGGMDPASHAGAGWHSASHSILLRHPMVRPWAPRYVPEPSIDEGTGLMRYDSAIEIDGPQLYDDSDGDGVRNDIAIGEGRNPFYTLEEALDATNLVWRTGGDRPWRALKTEEVPTGGFARSGAIDNGEATWAETTVKGAGTLSFKWRTSCQNRLDMIRLFVDGASQNRLFGQGGWETLSIQVEDVAEHVFRWAFTRGASGSAGENCAWLDEVVWTPDAAVNTRTLSVASRYDVCEPALGAHTHAWGDEIVASAAALYSNGLERATCTGWTGSGSAPSAGSGTSATFVIEEDSSLTWSWETEYRLDLAVTGDGTLSQNSGWFAEGAMAIVTATPGRYQRFVRWEGDTDGCRLTGATLRAPMTQGRSIRAVFGQATCELAVSNAWGEAWPTNGIHTFDMGAEITAWSTGIVEAGDTRYLCTGWTGAGSVPAAGAGTNTVFALLEDSSIDWAWQTNYLVRVNVEGDGTTDIGEAWIEAGSNLVVTATPGGTAYTAAIWSGDIDGAIPDGLRITVPVDGPKNISISFTALGIGQALEQESRQWVTGVDGPPWVPVTEGTHDGVDSCRSGAISGGYGESILSATFHGPGDLSFWWRLGDSASTCGVDLYVDGQDVNVWIVDAADWAQETVSLGDGEHVVEWIFWSDGLDPLATAWLDGVGFSGDNSPVAETHTTPVPVPYAWLDSFGLGGNSETGREEAAMALAANRRNSVWECYVAGLVPTNEASFFRTLISFVDGEMQVSWEPKLPPTEEAKRVYTIFGREKLETGSWMTPPNSACRFFKVDVEMK